MVYAQYLSGGYDSRRLEDAQSALFRLPSSLRSG